MKKAFSLVEILVVAAVIMILVALMLPRYVGKAKKGIKETVETPIERSHSAECMSDLRQLRSAYQIAAGADDENKPKTLQELARGFPASMTKCPVGGETYQYDPATGRVWCPHPGHERY